MVEQLYTAASSPSHILMCMFECVSVYVTAVGGVDQSSGGVNLVPKMCALLLSAHNYAQMYGLLLVAAPPSVRGAFVVRLSCTLMCVQLAR